MKEAGKVIFYALLLLVILLSIFGKDSKNTGQGEVVAYDSNVGLLGQPLQVGEVEYTINSYELTDELIGDLKIYKPSSDNAQFLIIDVTVKNLGKEEIKTRPGYFKAVSSDGLMFDAHSYYIDGLIQTEYINPTLSRTGKIIFEVSKEINDFDIQVQTDYSGRNKGLIILE